MKAQGIEQQTDTAALSKLAHAIIVAPVHCRQCGYNLRTLRADSYCPECGLEIWQTILHTVDPAASKLPSIRNPRAVGNALFGLMLAMMVQMALMTVPTVVQRLATWELPGMDSLIMMLPAPSWWVTGALALGSAACTWMLAPPIGTEPPGPVWRDVIRLGAGEVVWIISGGVLMHGALLWNAIEPEARLGLIALSAFSAIVALFGLRGVLRVISQRSSEYRRSQAGRQSAETMMAAVGCAAGGAALREMTRLHVFNPAWANVGTLILWAAMLMLCIGLGYLIVNAWWIRSALRKPPMTLDQVLLPPLDDDTSIPDTTTSGG